MGAATASLHPETTIPTPLRPGFVPTTRCKGDGCLSLCDRERERERMNDWSHEWIGVRFRTIEKILAHLILSNRGFIGCWFKFILPAAQPPQPRGILRIFVYLSSFFFFFVLKLMNFKTFFFDYAIKSTCFSTINFY